MLLWKLLIDFYFIWKKTGAVLAGRDLSRSSSSASHSKWNYCLHYIRSAIGVFEGFLKISKEVTLSLPFSFCSGVAQPSYCSSFLPGQNLWALPLVALVAATRKGLALACFSLPHQWLLVAVRVLHSLLSARWSEPRFFSASSQFSDHLGST